jgi:hypothetical protein
VDITKLSVTVALPVEATVEDVFDALADLTSTPRWSPECVHVSWLGDWRRAEPGARFLGRNRAGEWEWEVIGEVTEVCRPESISWVVLGDAGDPLLPSSTWRYRITERPGGSLITGTFRHGPGGSRLVRVMESAPDRAAAVVEFRREVLRHNMTATLTAMADDLGWRLPATDAATEAAASGDRSRSSAAD